MNKERFVELVKELNEDEFNALLSGINQITCEYGWESDLDDNDLIKETWKN